VTSFDWLRAEFALEGRTALVSGARGGIGRAAAIALAKAGADLVILGRDAGGLSDVCKEVASHDVSVRSVGVDLEDIAGVRRTALQIADTEVIDIVVNNAGSIHRAPLSSQSSGSGRAIMNVTVDAVVEITLQLAKAMIERGFGKIVNVASLLSFQGGINVAGYTASKHALVGLTKAMANEWSSLGVNVNAVAPGYIETANTAALRADPLRNADITARIPAGRWGVPDDIAGAIVFLCSHAARYVHGHVLVVDGGWMGR
jgi:2-deoxy-D-gluconate 3-dehydrogenase